MKDISANMKSKTYTTQSHIQNSNTDINFRHKELELKFKASEVRFENYAASIHKTAKEAHSEDTNKFPFYTNKKYRYWFMPFKVKVGYANPAFPKPFEQNS